MKVNNLLQYVIPFLCGVLLAPTASLANAAMLPEAPRRVQAEIKDSETARLPGNTKPIPALAQADGQVSSTQILPHMALRFALTVQQQEDLDQLLRQQQTKGSAQFHKFLTPEEYGARFGPNPQDVAQITAWLENEGFSNIQVARSRMFVSFDGTAGTVQNAFHTTVNRYVLDGEVHYANANDPSLPKAFVGMVESVRGLHDFRMKPKSIRKRNPHLTSNLTGNHFLAPGDYATIYNLQSLYQAGFDGSGVKIAVAGQSDIQLSDIRAFRTASGLAPNDPTILLTGTDPGLQSRSGDEGESDLDVEWAGAIARNATIVFVTSTDVSTSTTYAIDNNVAPVLSLSYGICEADEGRAASNTESSLYQQANAQGMTVVAASGDSGAADCDGTSPATQGLAVDIPASFPYVTGIGGTAFNEGSGTYWAATNNSFGGSALSYIPEIAWHDPDENGQTFSASGGGASTFNAKPSWQTGTGVPADGARDVPDLSFAASPSHDGVLVCSDGDCVSGFRNTDTTFDVVGGTSAGAPVFAGMVGLMVQAYGPQGNVNPNLYALAAASADVFHDVTSGDNIMACTIGTSGCPAGGIGYSAGVGYDRVTGLGSVDAYRLVSEWTSEVLPPVGTSSGPLVFVPLTPCRVVDTRNATGAFGGPELAAASIREFAIPGSTCQIPTTAVAYAMNVTVVPDGRLGYLSIWPSGQSRPVVSTLNSDGRVKANAAIVPAGVNGGVNVYVTDATQLIVDVSGYFVPAASSSGLQFFPLQPCRIADTRGAAGDFGGPFLAGGATRNFPVLSSGCSVPANAQAYSLNFTAIPRGALSFFSAWPTGQAQPNASVLNAPTGTVTANAAIIPAGTNGTIATFGSNNTDLVIDINGYFAPATTGGNNFYTLSPCRIVDTRNPVGALPLTGATTINVTTSGCQSPAAAKAFALNATAVPVGALQYLTLWPNGEADPTASTLNADANAITSNLAVVPNINGSINAYAAGSTYLILDISGYFAP